MTERTAQDGPPVALAASGGMIGDGTPQKLLDVSRLPKLAWTARTELRAGIAAAYRDYLDGGSR